MSAKLVYLARYSPPAKKWPKRARGKSRERKTPEQLWKCTPRSIARVIAGSAWANEHINTPGIKNDLPTFVNDTRAYTRWTAFEFATKEDMLKAGSFFKQMPILSEYPFTFQQRSFIAPKAAGKVISELYRNKKRFMSGIPLFIGKCALYQTCNISAELMASMEVSRAIKDLFYTTWIPWEGKSSDEQIAVSDRYFYATRLDAIIRDRNKKANAEKESAAPSSATSADTAHPDDKASDEPFDPEKPPI